MRLMVILRVYFHDFAHRIGHEKIILRYVYIVGNGVYGGGGLVYGGIA